MKKTMAGCKVVSEAKDTDERQIKHSVEDRDKTDEMA